MSADEPDEDGAPKGGEEELEESPEGAPPEVLPDEPLEAAAVDPEPVMGALEAALEAPPEIDETEEALRRARLAEDRLTEVLSAYRKIKSENEGFRDRTTRNVERRFDQRRERLLLKFIEILDNLDRALEAAEASHAANPLIEGLILVRTQLLQTLQEEGLERIPVLGLPYDPNFSEAVATQPVDDPDHDHVVVKELMRGYRLKGRVARASRVVVGEHGKPVLEEELPPGDLIGADELPATAEPEAAAAVDEEATLEEIIADADGPAAAAPEDEHVTLGDSLLEPEEKD